MIRFHAINHQRAKEALIQDLDCLGYRNINLQTTLSQLAKLMGQDVKFNLEYKDLKKGALHWETTLEWYIYQMYYPINKIPKTYKDLGFQYGQIGVNPCLGKIAGELKNLTGIMEENENPEGDPNYLDIMSYYILCEFFIKGRNYKKLVRELEEVKEETREHNCNTAIEENDLNHVQKIAWLHEMGVLKPIVERCTINGITNYLQAAKLISTFASIKNDSIRKSLQAICAPSRDNERHHPLKNPQNLLVVQQLKIKYNLV